MALNLGPEAYEAIQRLKGSAEWRSFVAALENQMQVFMHRALEVPHDERADATGYARALRDILAHIELIEKPQVGSQKSKPSVKARVENMGVAHV